MCHRCKYLFQEYSAKVYKPGLCRTHTKEYFAAMRRHPIEKHREYIQNVMLKYMHRTDAFKTLVLKSKLFILWLIKLNVPFWRRKWQPTPVLLLGESHGQRSLEGYSPWGYKESNMTE